MGRRQLVSDAGAASIDSRRRPWRRVAERTLVCVSKRSRSLDRISPAARRWTPRRRGLAGPLPKASAPRAKAATAFLALGAVALALTVPRSTMLLHGSSAPRDPALAAPRANGSAEALLPEVQKQLEALLAAAEKGTLPPGAAPATAAELRSLIARLNALRDAGKLNELARAMAPAAGSQIDQPAEEMKAVADRARKAAEMPTVPPEVRDTLQKVSDDMADAANASQPPNDKAGQMVSSKDPQQKTDTAPGKKGGEVDDASIQSVSEAESGGGAGIIMMGAGGRRTRQGGAGARSRRRLRHGTSGGRMADLEAALRQETVEASMDNAGENVQTEARRKTERGQAGVTYSHSGAAAFDRGRAVAPPPCRKAGARPFRPTSSANNDDIHRRRAVHRSVPRPLRPHHPGSRAPHRRPRRGREPHGDEPARRRPRAARRRSRPRQDDPGAHARRRPAPDVLAHPVHARPDAGRHRRHQHRPGARARRHVLRVPARADLRQRRARRRDQPRHAEDAVGAARGDAGRQRHGRARRPTGSSSRSSCSRRRTRSRWRAPIRCPKRSSIASSSS